MSASYSDVLELVLSLSEDQLVEHLQELEAKLTLAKEALEVIAVNNVPGGHDQNVAREALEKLK